MYIFPNLKSQYRFDNQCAVNLFLYSGSSPTTGRAMYRAPNQSSVLAFPIVSSPFSVTCEIQTVTITFSFWNDFITYRLGLMLHSVSLQSVILVSISCLLIMCSELPVKLHCIITPTSACLHPIILMMMRTLHRKLFPCESSLEIQICLCLVKGQNRPCRRSSSYRHELPCSWQATMNVRCLLENTTITLDTINLRKTRCEMKMDVKHNR